MAQGLFGRFVFIFNFLNVNYFSFLYMLGLVIHHFWWNEYFSRTPGSYRYTNSVELVPRFSAWPSPPSRTPPNELPISECLYWEFNTYLWYGALVIRMTLLICLSSFSICNFIMLNFLCMCVYTCIRTSLLFHIGTHLLPFSCVLFVLCSILIPTFFFACFLRNSIDTWVTVSIDVIIPLYIPNPLIPSVFPLCNLYIHHPTVLMSTLVRKQVNFTIIYTCEHRNSIETWLQSQYLKIVLHILNINNEMSKSNIKFIII